MSASAGSTSGSGLASAKTMGSLAMVGIHSASRMPGAETPTKTSASTSTSCREPAARRGLVAAASSVWAADRDVASADSAPSRSTTTTSRAPAASSSVTIAVPAAPAPDTTIRTSASSFFTTRSALVSAASTTIAVPCWSSWKTGMSRDSRSRRSISKQRGAAMSSRLMPPNPGAIISTALTISSVSWVARQMGQASMSAKRLKSAALPSITGSAAPGPMLPSPSTAEPSVTTATELPLIVSFRTSSGFS